MGTEKAGQWAKSLADAYSRLECLINECAGQDQKRQKSPKSQPEPGTEALLFLELVRIYVEEEEIRVRQKLKRKSSQRISRVMHERMGAFLAERIAGISVQVMDGLLFLQVQGQTVAAIKCIPDLGSYDTPSWNATIARFAKQYEKRYKLAPDRLLFVVCSLAKSLDAQHAKALTGIDVWCGSALTAPVYREALQTYVSKCVEAMDAVPNPRGQVYFLSPGAHPNTFACQLLRGEPAVMPDGWLKPSVNELMQYVQSRCYTDGDFQ
ncbi:hypothetical protein [Brevibacillus parabrevis]|uniref:hypothetical protein n=1 Tax=Brevibacillus parabrevis TaxID=54914 RepID=UPI001139B93E|nr:hypothetical protein [Brevibacillus parabrevis]TGV30915.1 hypothetical protein EN829_035145 [Mesorhizobium sp. M00.F.Ca.ET.186.01.1.1]